MVEVELAAEPCLHSIHLIRPNKYGKQTALQEMAMLSDILSWGSVRS